MTPQEIANALGKAEASVRELKYDELETSVPPILKELDEGVDSAATRAKFSVENLARLARVLRLWANNWSLNAYGNDKRSQDRFEDAQRVLAKASYLYPMGNDAKLQLEQGTLHFDQGQYDQAWPVFDQIISASPPGDSELKAAALLGMGATLRELLSFLKADDYLRQATDALGKLKSLPTWNPALPEQLMIERGWLHFYQEQYDLSLKFFADALQKASERNDQLEARAGQLASLQTLDSQNPQDQKHAANKLLERWLTGSSPEISKDDAVHILLTCGEQHSLLNRYPAALSAYRLLVEHADGNPKGWWLLIDSLKWLRRYGEAESVYLKAQKKFRVDIVLWKEMAHIYFVLKRIQDSHDYYTGEVLERPTAITPPFLTATERQTLQNALRKDTEANEWIIVTLRKKRELRAAEKKVNELLIDPGEKTEFLCEKAFICLTKRDYKTAIALFERSLNLEAYDPFAYQWLAASYRKQREFATAKEKVNEALLMLPLASGLYEELAWIAFDQNEFEEADKLFDRAISIDPYLIQRRVSRFEVLTRVNRNADALQLLLDLKKEFPDDLEIAEQLGWCYLRRGELDEADRQFCFIEQKSKGKNVLGINGRGGYYLELREYESAEREFRRAIKKVPYEPQYHINLAWALLRQVKEPGELPLARVSERKDLLEGARKSCFSALEYDEFNVKAHVCLGVIAFRRGALPDAEGYFIRSIDLSRAEGGHVELGALYVQMGRYEEAEKALQEAITCNPNDARAYIELGNLRVAQGKYPEAVRQCRSAVAVEPNNDDAHRALAIALMRNNQLEEAEPALRNGLMRVGSSRRWRLHLALSQTLILLADEKNKEEKKKDTGLYNEALQQVFQARRDSSQKKNADVLFHTGIAYFKLDAFKDSIKSFRECVSADRDRFEAERYGKLVQAKIDSQKLLLNVNIEHSRFFVLMCATLLVLLWMFYLFGSTRPVPVAEAKEAPAAKANTGATENAPSPAATPEPTNAQKLINNVLKTADEAKAANARAVEAMKRKEAAVAAAATAVAAAKAARPARKAALTKVADENSQEANRATEASRLADAAKVDAVASAEEAVKKAATPPKPPEEVLVDKQMLTIYTPLLLALLVIGLLLPNVSEVKLPGGLEAKVSAVNPEISSGPKGDVGFGSSLPIISPGPR